CAKRGGEVFWVVALHRMAGFGDRDVAALRQSRRQPLGVLFMEDVAFGASHDQGRAGYFSEAFGEPAPLRGVGLAHLLKAPAVVFPGPISISLLAEIVHQAAA